MWSRIGSSGCKWDRKPYVVTDHATHLRTSSVLIVLDTTDTCTENAENHLQKFRSVQPTSEVRAACWRALTLLLDPPPPPCPRARPPEGMLATNTSYSRMLALQSHWIYEPAGNLQSHRAAAAAPPNSAVAPGADNAQQEPRPHLTTLPKALVQHRHLHLNRCIRSRVKPSRAERMSCPSKALWPPRSAALPTFPEGLDVDEPARMMHAYSFFSGSRRRAASCSLGNTHHCQRALRASPG
jgi:hypothetical protein